MHLRYPANGGDISVSPRKKANVAEQGANELISVLAPGAYCEDQTCGIEIASENQQQHEGDDGRVVHTAGTGVVITPSQAAVLSDSSGGSENSYGARRLTHWSEARPQRASPEGTLWRLASKRAGAPFSAHRPGFGLAALPFAGHAGDAPLSE